MKNIGLFRLMKGGGGASTLLACLTLLIAAGCPGTSDETVEPAQALVGSGPSRIMVGNDVTKIQIDDATKGVTEMPFLAVVRVGENDVVPGTAVYGTWGQEVQVKAYYKDGAVLAGLKAGDKALSLVPGAPHGAASDYAYGETFYKYSLYRFTMPKKAVTINGKLAASSSPDDLIALEGGAAFNTKLDRLEIAGMTGSFRKSAEGDDAEFDGDTTEWYADVPYSAYPLGITAVPEETGASATIVIDPSEGNAPGYDGGECTVTVTVTSMLYTLYPDSDLTPDDLTAYQGDGYKKRVYTIHVKVDPAVSNTKLAELSVSGTAIEIGEGTGPYTTEVQNNVTSLSISAKAESASARTQVLRADDVELEPDDVGFAELTASADKTVAFGGATASFTVVVYAENTDSSKYTLTVSRDDGSLPLMATGGTRQIIEAPDGTLYEVHVFDSNGALTFTDPAPDSIVADYLIVAGGGGGGQPSSAGTDQGGGGGAGGLLYETGKTLATNSPIAVTVGAGGGTNADGGYSYLGTIKVPGGGRGGKADNSGQIGGNGGSGGGDGSSTGTAEPTTVSSGKRDTASGGGGAYIYNDVLGYGGGLPANSGGGGGGAKGAGGNGVTNSTGGTGGAGWNPSSTEGATWIKDVTGRTEFSHGGWGGWYNNTATGAAAAAAANYGDGGNASATNKSGHSGIVVVRWPYVAPADN